MTPEEINDFLEDSDTQESKDGTIEVNRGLLWDDGKGGDSVALFIDFFNQELGGVRATIHIDDETENTEENENV